MKMSIIGIDVENESQVMEFKDVADMANKLAINITVAKYLLEETESWYDIAGREIYFLNDGYEVDDYLTFDAEPDGDLNDTLNAFDKEAEAYRKMSMAEALERDSVINMEKEDCKLYNAIHSEGKACPSKAGALGGEDGGNYDDKGNSSHYQSQFMEFVRDQERKYGTIVAAIICQSNVDKYNQRAGVKEGVPASKDLVKRDWYAKAFRHFMEKIKLEEVGLADHKNRNSFVPMAEEVVDLLRCEIYVKESRYVPLSECIEK